MKNKKTWVMISLLVLLLGGCFGDRVISEMVFAYQCKNNTGIFVYETVNLDDSYIVSIPDDIRKRDSRFEINSEYMIDKEKFSIEHDFTVYQKQNVSHFGPVELFITSIKRKADGVVLAKAISVRSRMGWFMRAITFGHSNKECPGGLTDDGKYAATYNHKELVKKTFRSNQMEK